MASPLLAALRSTVPREPAPSAPGTVTKGFARGRPRLPVRGRPRPGARGPARAAGGDGGAPRRRAEGGFNGTDPAPTLAQFQADVAAGAVHYFVGDEQSASISTTVAGTTVYDLTAPVAAS